MTTNVHRAAAEIAALINIRPSSPSAGEIAGIIGRFAAPAPVMSPAYAALHAEWRALIEEHGREFGADRCPGSSLTPAVKAWEDRMAAHIETIDALVDRIHDTTAQTWGDILLLAEVCFWRSWPGSDPRSSDGRAQMAAGATGRGEASDDALAKLLEAIFALACSGTAAEVAP